MKTLLIIFASLLYLCLSSFIVMTSNALAYTDVSQEVYDQVIGIPAFTGTFIAVVAAIVAFFIILFSFLSKKKLTYRFILIIKMVLIPYYVGNFVMWGIYGVGTALVNIFFFAIFISIGVLFTYLTLLATSTPLISRIIVDLKKDRLPKWVLIAGIVASFIYFADVAFSLILYIQDKRKKEEEKEVIDIVQ